MNTTESQCNEAERDEIESGYKRLIGRTPNKAQLLDLIHIKQALKLRGDDPLWMILYAMEYYQAAAKRIPAEINSALARTEAVLSQFDATRLPEGRFYRMLGRWGQARIIGGAIGALALAIGIGLLAGRLSVAAPARELAALNGGGQLLMSCFNGMGRIVKHQDGQIYCYPVSPDGKALGFIVK